MLNARLTLTLIHGKINIHHTRVSLREKMEMTYNNSLKKMIWQTTTITS